jgi:Tfp pilus assembly protein PilV
MHSFFATLLAGRRPRGQRFAAHSKPTRVQELLRRRLPDPELLAAEDGVLLIEVVITAFLVGLIVVGTFAGFGAARGTTADERNHNEAILLAAESQAELRSDPASLFDTPTNNYQHIYTKTINNQKYTITQSASFLNAAGESTACSATNTSRQETNSVRLTSAVTWPRLTEESRSPVTASAVTTPPTGSNLEIDVGNYPTPTAGVAGVASTVTYTPVEQASSSTVAGTTETPGCVVFTDLPTTAAIVEIAEKSGYISPAGAWKWPTKEVTIAPNYTTHYPVTLNQGGALKAAFTYKGETSFTNTKPNTGTATRSEEVRTDSLVAYNEHMESTPDFELGFPKDNTGSSNGTYTPHFGTTSSESYAHEIETPTESVKYSHGNLFPFTSTEAPWKLYAGACVENNPEKLGATTASGSKIADTTASVTSNTTTAVSSVPVAYMRLTVDSGTKSSHGNVETATAYPVTIKNTGCKSVTPNNETAINEPKSEQSTSTGSEWGGHLEHPFLPFGAGTLCLAYNSGSKHITYTTAYKIAVEEEYQRVIFLGESPHGGFGGSTGEYTETVRAPGGGSETETVSMTSSSGTATCS